MINKRRRPLDAWFADSTLTLSSRVPHDKADKPYEHVHGGRPSSRSSTTTATTLGRPGAKEASPTSATSSTATAQQPSNPGR